MRLQTLVVVALAVAVASGCDDAVPTEAETPEAETAVTMFEAGSERAGVVKSGSIVTEFPNGAVVPGASARVKRVPNGVNSWLQTSGLTPGNAYTLWVVVFNRPEACVVPNECRLADIGAADPAVGVDLILGGGHVVGASGRSTFAGRVAVGDVGIRGVGLEDALEAEIHLVVRDHGPKLPGSAQLREFGGGCDAYACANVQDALHF